MRSFDPEVFGEYLLVRRLAETQMAETLVAVRLGDRSGRSYVIKRPRLGERASGPAAQAILREVEVLTAVTSPHLVALESSGSVGGLPFIALEHVRGAPLDRILAGAGALGEIETRAIARDVLGALVALHEAGWVHGDVAPSNVMVDETGESRLIDFGIARRQGETRPLPAGKPGYIAPEGVGGRGASPSEDVYGWGVVAAECLLGRRLFPEHDLSEAATREPITAVVRDLDEWDPILVETLSLDSAKRPSAKAARDRLAPCPEGRASLADIVAHTRAAQDRTSREAPAPAGSAQPGPTRNDGAGVLIGAETPPRELTPTAPLVVAIASDPPAADRSADRSADLSRPGDARAAATPPRRSVAVFALIAIVSALGGWMAGRRTGSRGGQEASLGLSAALPARGRLAIDGRTIALPEPGKKIPVEPGRHSISITAPRKDSTQVFDVVVGPGEHVVLLVQPGGGASNRKSDRRSDDGSETSAE